MVSTAQLPAQDRVLPVHGDTLRGVVRDKKTHEPIAGATIALIWRDENHHLKQLSKFSGEFLIMKSDIVSLHITSLGYRDTIVAIPSGSTIEILLDEKPTLGEDIVVTAQKHTSASQDVPISVSIVKSGEITSRSPEAIDFALRYIPGVSVTESQVNIRGSSGYARSVGSRVLFLLDGMSFLSADNGDIKFDALPIMNVDRIEVVKGAGSALYGSSALGGVINVITRKPTEQLHGAFSASIGKYDGIKYSEWQVPGLTRRIGIFEGGITGTLGEIGLLGSIAVKRNEGYRLGDDSYKSSGFLKVTTPLSGHDRSETSLLFANEDHGGFLWWRDLNHPLLPADSLGAVNGRIHSFKTNVQSSLQSILSDHTILNSRASILYTNFSTNASKSGDPPGPHSNATNYNLQFDVNTDAFGPIYFTSGILGLYQTVNSDLFQTHRGLTFGAFAQGEYKLNPCIFTLGIREDVSRYDDSAFVGSASPKFGISFDAGRGLNFRSSVGTGFRAPTIGEKFIHQVFSGFPVIPNPGLTPEKSYSAEFGGSYRTSNLYLDGAIFYSSFNNLIEAGFVSGSGVNAIQFRNLTSAETFGHEEVIEYYPFSNDDLTLRLGYTYVFPRDRVTKQILNFRPRHLLQARAEGKWGGLSLSSDLRYISRYESLDSILITQVRNGDERVDAYIWDARVGYTLDGVFADRVTVSFQVQNLLNYYYVEIVGNLAPIREFMFRVETIF